MVLLSVLVRVVVLVFCSSRLVDACGHCGRVPTVWSEVGFIILETGFLNATRLIKFEEWISEHIARCR